MAEDETEETLPQPRPFPKEMVEDAESKAVGHQIRDYLWGKGPVEHENVSAHLRRDLVSRFVGFEMPDLPPQNFWRIRILADLYNLKEYLGNISTYVNGGEATPEELDRSIACTIVLEEIGDEAFKQRALQFYEGLTRNRFANERVEELIQCLAVFGDRASAEPLRKRIEQEVKSLSQREKAEPDAGVERRFIEGVADNELFFVEEANKARKRIDAIESADRRLIELILAYLEITDDGGAEYFTLWVQQQLRRAAEADGTEKVVRAFRHVVSNLSKLGAKDVRFCKIRAYNAIEYFLGKLTSDEEVFMSKNREKQTDPLRYMPIGPVWEQPEEPEPVDEDEDEMDGSEEANTEAGNENKK